MCWINHVMGTGTLRPSNVLTEVDNEKEKTEIDNVKKECKVGATNLPLPHCQHLRSVLVLVVSLFCVP